MQDEDRRQGKRNAEPSLHLHEKGEEQHTTQHMQGQVDRVVDRYDRLVPDHPSPMETRNRDRSIQAPISKERGIPIGRRENFDETRVGSHERIHLNSRDGIQDIAVVDHSAMGRHAQRAK
jgi:hypothetical protein